MILLMVVLMATMMVVEIGMVTPLMVVRSSTSLSSEIVVFVEPSPVPTVTSEQDFTAVSVVK